MFLKGNCVGEATVYWPFTAQKGRSGKADFRLKHNKLKGQTKALSHSVQQKHFRARSWPSLQLHRSFEEENQ